MDLSSVCALPAPYQLAGPHPSAAETDLRDQHHCSNTPASHSTTCETLETLRNRTADESGEGALGLAEGDISALNMSEEPDPPDRYQHNNTPVSNYTTCESPLNTGDWTSGGDEEDVTDPDEINTPALSANPYTHQ